MGLITPDGSPITPSSKPSSALLGAFEMIVTYLVGVLEEEAPEEGEKIDPQRFLFLQNREHVIYSLNGWQGVAAQELTKEANENGIQFAGTVGDFLTTLEGGKA